jgi:uncharacterized membrane protein YedE/YeeE
MRNAKYFFPGVLFGIALTKSEASSWFRIQEMARFHELKLYGVFLAAIVVGALSVQVLKRLKVSSLEGEPIAIPPKRYHHGNLIGSFLFGIGIAITGACPGPLYAQLGSGHLIVLVVILGGLVGAWTYSYFRPKLPH